MKTKWKFLLGSVALPRPTGVIATDDEGWNYEVYTDRIEYDHRGNIVSRKPAMPVMRWRWE